MITEGQNRSNLFFELVDGFLDVIVEQSERNAQPIVDPIVDCGAKLNRRGLLTVGDRKSDSSGGVLNAEQLAEQTLNALLSPLVDNALVGDAQGTDVHRGGDGDALDVVTSRCSDAVANRSTSNLPDRKRHALR